MTTLNKQTPIPSEQIVFTIIILWVVGFIQLVILTTITTNNHMWNSILFSAFAPIAISIFEFIVIFGTLACPYDSHDRYSEKIKNAMNNNKIK